MILIRAKSNCFRLSEPRRFALAPCEGHKLEYTPKIYGTLDPEGGVFIEDIKVPSFNLDRFLWVEFNRDPVSVRWAAEIEFTTIEPIADDTDQLEAGSFKFAKELVFLRVMLSHQAAIPRE